MDVGVDAAVLGARVPSARQRGALLLALRGFLLRGHRGLGRGGRLEHPRVGRGADGFHERLAEHAGLVVDARWGRVVQHPLSLLRDGRLQGVNLRGGGFLRRAPRHERRERVRVIERSLGISDEIPASLVEQGREVRVAVDAEVVERIAVVEGRRGCQAAGWARGHRRGHRCRCRRRRLQW